MTKFWMVVAAILALGTTTGCPDGDDCASDPSLCDPDSDTDTDAGADADADADTTEDDGDTSEVASCPNIASDWALTYVNELFPGEDDHRILTLEQNDDCQVTGHDDNPCDYSGTISEGGDISLTRDCAGNVREITGTLTISPSHMRGNWHDTYRPDHGTWTADPQ